MGSHKIVHVEFPANDPKSASEFYTGLFDWKHEAFPEWNYYAFDTGEGTGGGYNPVGDGSGGLFPVEPGDVLVYVSTDDIEASLARAEELGGKMVTPRTEIPGMGWYAVFSDPTGNKVGLFACLESASA